jgi:hypothetical protein
MWTLKQGSPLWLDLRKRFLITGSRVPALVGCHYESLNAYYQTKRFGKVRAQSDFTSDAMAWGNDNEERAFQDFLKDFPPTPRAPCEWRYSDGLHVWGHMPTVAGSPDACGYWKGSGNPPWTLEIKCPYAGKWQNADTATEMFQKKPQHWIQLQMNMACCGSVLGAFYVWDYSPDADRKRRRLVICKQDPILVDWLKEKIVWWEELLKKENPPSSIRLPNGTKADALVLIKASTENSITMDRWYYDDMDML